MNTASRSGKKTRSVIRFKTDKKARNQMARFSKNEKVLAFPPEKCF